MWLGSLQIALIRSTAIFRFLLCGFQPHCYFFLKRLLKSHQANYAEKKERRINNKEKLLRCEVTLAAGDMHRQGEA